MSQIITDRKTRVAPGKQKKQRRSIKTDRDFLTTLLKRGEATVVDAKLLKKNTKSAVWSHFGAIKLSESFTHETIDLESIVDQGKIMQICKHFVACYECFAVFKYDGHAYGTTGLIKHIKLCTKTPCPDTAAAASSVTAAAASSSNTSSSAPPPHITASSIAATSNANATNTTNTNNNNNSTTTAVNQNNNSSNNATTTISSGPNNIKASNKKRKTPVTPPLQKRPRRSIKTDRDFLTGLLQNGSAKVVDAKHLKKNIKSAVWSHYGAISLGDNISNPAIDVESNVDDGKIMQICKNFVACNDCFTVFKYDGHAYGTTGLVKHIKLCQKSTDRPQIKMEVCAPPEMSVDQQHQQGLQTVQLNQENATQDTIAILQQQDGISEEQIANDGDGTIMVIVYEDTNDDMVMSV